MTAGELVIVLAALLCAIGFAALVVVLMRVLDMLRDLPYEVADLRAETRPLIAELRETTDEARTTVDEARSDLERFDRVLGSAETVNQSLEKAGRVADFMELGELLCKDALERDESCGGHFREEHQTPEGEAQRNDEEFKHVSAWERKNGDWTLHREPLEFEYVKLTQRSYK